MCGVTHFFHMPLLLPPAIKAMPALGVQPVATHSEKAAAYMADGYARASGRLGVCGAQAIGAANLAAGLLDALMARSPVLALTGGGSTETRDRNTYQEIDQRPIYAGLTKFSARVDAAHRLPDLLNQAMRAATTGTPGPVHLELGGFTGGVLDGEAVSIHRPDPRFAIAPALRFPADAADVSRAADRIAHARRPIVIAGSGVRAGRAEAALARFVERWQLPLATSLDAKAALPDAHPLNAGVTGNYARDTANMAVAEADLIVFAGSTTGSMATSDWNVARPGTPTIQIDIDPRELGRNFPLDVGLAGDPATVLDQLADVARTTNRSAWHDRIAALKLQWRIMAEADERSDALPIAPQRLCRDLSESLPEGALVVVDTGHSGTWAARNLYLDRPGQGLLRAAGSLGWSYPAALGAKCAQPDRPVVCFNGDGAFLYHFAEMETAMRYGINTVTIVNNNQGFSQERPVWRESAALDENWRFSPVSYTRVAKGFGLKTYHVEKPADLRPALRAALAEHRPTLIEVMSDHQITCPPPWRP
ncbi:thiamine pyrophosphate-binding protein [Sphingomonas panacis]|nr:thiamine pyrophosphate-binding protein [Sphingomonas panacis]